MAQAVWKFDLEVADFQIVKMPVGAKLLSIQSQGGVLRLWALVDPNVPNVGHRAILCIGTGHRITNLGLSMFIATVQDGPFVWHFFDGGWQ